MIRTLCLILLLTVASTLAFGQETMKVECQAGDEALCQEIKQKFKDAAHPVVCDDEQPAIRGGPYSAGLKVEEFIDKDLIKAHSFCNSYNDYGNEKTIACQKINLQWKLLWNKKEREICREKSRSRADVKRFIEDLARGIK